MTKLTLSELELKDHEANLDKKHTKPWCLIAILVVTALGVGATVGVLFGVGILGDDSASKNGSSSLQSSNLAGQNEITMWPETDHSSAPTTEGDEIVFDRCHDSGRRKLEDISHRILQQQESKFQSIGCFQSQFSVDSHPVLGETKAERAEECSGLCLTLFFGITEEDNTCWCFFEAPQARLAIGSCASVDDCDVPEDSRMETYFKPEETSECNQELTSAVRNFLVEEDDVPFGFDLITNTFQQSPFELYKKECGTNIYEVQTEVSEGSKQLKTTVQTVNEFSLERRSQLSQSVSYGASASYESALFSVAASVSGSNDQEQLSVFQSSGADSAGSKVFTSLGVKRIAEVKIDDFDNKKYFVTLTPQFASLIRSYREGGFQNATAETIISTYGHTVLVRGMFGGYMQIRTTATNIDTERLFSSEEESRRCYEVSVSAKASAYGFSGSVNAGTSGCSEEATNSFSSLQASYATETSEQAVFGGGVVDGEFVVPPKQSRLLTTRDKYPEGDDGIELRLLSDFLDPTKISPLEVRRSLITETEFGEIQRHLQEHILDSLQEKADILGECSDCEVPYLEQTPDGAFQCRCYEPKLLTRSPTSSPSAMPTANPTMAPRMKLTDISIRVGDHWGLSTYENTKPSITVGGKTYYPYGNKFKHITQSSWYHFGGFEVPDLLPGLLELRIQIHGHGSDYVWYLQPDEWFKPKQNFETKGQDTNNNGNYLKWKFDVVAS